MRTARRKRSHKKSLTRKTKRRRKFNKSSNFMFDSTIRDNSAFNLETINEVLRIHKTARAEGKGSWKVMPKDSCEVYKKRQQKGTINGSDCSSDMQQEKDDLDDTYTRKKKRTRLQTGRNTRKTKCTKERFKARKNDSSASPSSHSTTYSLSSCTSYSEMDYE